MSGKIITRVRERQRRQQFWERAHQGGYADGLPSFERKPPSLLDMLKNWRQWFFKDGRDGGM